jgi:hypothetical protein
LLGKRKYKEAKNVLKYIATMNNPEKTKEEVNTLVESFVLAGEKDDSD